MATVTSIPAIASLAAADEFVTWDTSESGTRKATITQLLTLLNTTYAQLAAANTFTQNQTIDKTNPWLSFSGSGAGRIVMTAMDNGANPGHLVALDRNNASGTEASGSFGIRDRGNTYYYIWPDDTGVWRTHTAQPTSATDTAGTVIGTQTSSLDKKDIIPGTSTIATVMNRITEGARSVHKFQYKESPSGDPNIPGVRPYGGEVFEGVVVDFAPAYGTDRDEGHPSGKSLNEINILGDLLRAVNYLAQRVATLEAAQK